MTCTPSAAAGWPAGTAWRRRWCPLPAGADAEATCCGSWQACLPTRRDSSTDGTGRSCSAVFILTAAAGERAENIPVHLQAEGHSFQDPPLLFLRQLRDAVHRHVTHPPAARLGSLGDDDLDAVTAVLQFGQ